MKRIVVIGGGISGLATAHRVLELSAQSRVPVDLKLLEASSRVGGVIQTQERDGFLLERGPDSFISEKPAALQLAKRLNLEPELIETNERHRRSFIAKGNKLLPTPEGFYLLAPSRLWPLVTSDIISWPAKFRVALDLILPRGNPSAGDESLADFVRRRLGREALARVAQPMVGGIYTADPELLSLRATMPRFPEMERQHRSLILALRKQKAKAADASGARYSLFLSFKRGMQVLADRLRNRICERGFEQRIQTDTAVSALTIEGDPPTWKVMTAGSETFVADEICLALPAYRSAQLLSRVDPQLASELGSTPYASTATLNLAYKRGDVKHPLDGFGFVVPFVERRTVIACTFSSVKFAGRAPEDHVLLRVFVGGALQPETLALSEGEIVKRVRNDLRDLLGIHSEPIFVETSRWWESMPQYHLGHLERIERIFQRVKTLPNLTLAGNAYSGPGIPDCIRSGEEAAEQLIG